MLPRIVAASNALVMLVLLVGCGSKSGSGDVITHDQMLTDTKALLDEYHKTKKSWPKKLADLDALEPAYPAAVHGISSGKCVYVWGAGLTGGNAVLAYQKETPDQGGPVLLQDGTVKKMSADEFKAAPKAK